MWLMRPFNPTTPEEEAIWASLSNLQPTISKLRKEFETLLKLSKASVSSDIIQLKTKHILLSHTFFQTASTDNDKEIFILPPKGWLLGTAARVRETFSGGSISSYKFSIGVSGSDTTLSKYMEFYELTEAVSDANGAMGNVQDIPNFGTYTSIRGRARSEGDNLSESSTGILELWIPYFVLP